MRIGASLIDSWAERAEAKGLLPELVRRLIAATAELTELAVRGADTNNFGGWDGVVTARAANAWVPEGRSRWEMGCSADVIDKARDDFRKRSDDTAAEQARDIAFVFVSPRIWAGKDAWRAQAAANSYWRLVRAYDADDLATWLESAGSVALWFGELLGVRGPSVSTVASTWDTWRNQSAVPISHEALISGRSAQVEQFANAVAQRPGVLTVCADSSEEAVAFACAQLDALGLSNQAVCVTQAEGWSFVDAHPGLQLLVAATTHAAAARAPRAGQCLIVPAHLGDLAIGGAVGRNGREGEVVVLQRTDAESFRNALVDLGEEPADASRWAQSCGRSWSVYRRRRASNTAISRPPWMQVAAHECLTTIVLVGAWNERKAGDRACIEAVTGRRYEDVERDLRKLAQLDDSPVLRIGDIWKAKAPLELLYLFAPALTREEIRRFFFTALAVLVKPDPALELEPDKRWMAAVYGHVREESGIVIESIVDSLIKLRLYAEDTERHDLMADVDQLVKGLLENANGDRWLSLCGVLRQLAEASPDLFLSQLEASLRCANPPVRALFSNGSNDAFTDPSYHVNLLWALEILAWSPKHLAKVCDCLARLADAPVKSNMRNRPSNSLASVLRAWWPQTTASAQRRLEVLDRLIAHHEHVAWELLLNIVPNGSMFASANAKPRWRDFDAGAPRSDEWVEADVYIPAVVQRVLDSAEGQAARIALLVGRIDSFEGTYRERLLAMIYRAVALPDAERQFVRDALRRRLNWQFSFNASNQSAMVEAHALRTLFDALAPDDLVLRHAWLFASGWVELPDGKEENYQETDLLRAKLRGDAFSEIFAASGWRDVVRLAKQAESPGLVGWEIAIAPFLEHEFPGWALGIWRESTPPAHDALWRGLVHGLSAERRMAFLADVQRSATPKALTNVLQSSPFDRSTWDFVEALPLEARIAYWREVCPGVVLGEGEDLLFVVDKLIDAGRHRTAFNVLQFCPQHVGTSRLVTILNAIRSGAEPDGGQLDGWRIGEALAVLEEDTDFPHRDLAVMEYHFFDAFRQGDDRKAKVLFAEMLRDPGFFMDVVSLARPGDNEDVSTETRSHAWSVLHEGRGTPGLGTDGVVDRARFFEWIGGVRNIAQQRDRADFVDSTIGMWLSNCREEQGGAWPCVAVRELLEDPSSERIRNGLLVGVLNNRGVHSRAIGAGGSPERSLASHFREAAAGMWCTFPRTAETLEDIAKSYEWDAKRHDNDAALWREGAA